MRVPNPPKVLIISYLFPPIGGIGVQRALSLAKYLPQSGWEVHVLKATNAGGPVIDPDLVKQIPASVRVHTAITPEIPFAFRQKLWARLNKPTSGAAGQPSKRTPWIPWRRMLSNTVKRILSPEPEILWKPFAVLKASRIIHRHKIDVVVITVPPFSALTVGVALKRRFPELKVVSDFRDEWLSFYLKDFEFQNSSYARRRAEEIERAAVENSDLVVAVTPTSLAEIRKRYPGESDHKFFCLPNGYDPEVFAGFEHRQRLDADILIAHLGTVYGTASPRYYLDALEALPDEIGSRIRTRFVGRVSDNERAVLESRKARLEILGFMPQAEALRQVEDADYLLLNMSNDISLPGKLFEYLAIGKPILAITPRNGEVNRLLEATGAGLCADPDDREGIKALLTGACSAKSGSLTPVKPNPDAIRRYERPRLTAEYATILSDLLHPSPGPPR